MPSGDDDARLLFSHDTSIFTVNLLSFNKSEILSRLQGVFTLDYDYKHQMVCVVCVLSNSMIDRIVVDTAQSNIFKNHSLRHLM